MILKKSFIKKIIPPFLLSIIRNFNRNSLIISQWSGNYDSWADANLNCTGYNSEPILDKCKNALLKVKSGEAKYERDSVLFDEIQYSWGLLVGLQNAALENNGELCVLDFGGSLGSSYFQNRSMLNSLKKIYWCIIEQPDFVKCGKQNFENHELKFFNTVEDCMKEFKPNILIISGVLQYLEDPYLWLEKLVSLGIKNIIFDRTSFINFNEDILTVQNVPESIYHASYPAWFFNREKFLGVLTDRYSQLFEFDSRYTDPNEVNGLKVYWTGFYFKKNNE